MWNAVGSPHRAWPFVTSIGTPRAAQTLLKLTPAAIVATRTSCEPSSGTSITSSRIESLGSPNRSGRPSIGVGRRANLQARAPAAPRARREGGLPAVVQRGRGPSGLYDPVGRVEERCLVDVLSLPGPALEE